MGEQVPFAADFALFAAFFAARRESASVGHEVAVAMQAEALCLAREMRDLKESEVPVTASAG